MPFEGKVRQLTLLRHSLLHVVLAKGALSQPGQTVEHHGVSIWGGSDVPSQLPVHASKLYGANLTAFLKLLDAGDPDDEILRGSRVTAGGEIVHETVLAAQPEQAVNQEKKG